VMHDSHEHLETMGRSQQEHASFSSLFVRHTYVMKKGFIQKEDTKDANDFAINPKFE
jgi:hypothetical protein